MILFGFFLKPPMLTVVSTWPLPDAWLRQCPSFFSVAMIKTSRHETAEGRKVFIWLRFQVTVHHFGNVEAGIQNITPIMKSRGMEGVWIPAVCLCSAITLTPFKPWKWLLTTDMPQTNLLETIPSQVDLLRQTWLYQEGCINRSPHITHRGCIK